MPLTMVQSRVRCAVLENMPPQLLLRAAKIVKLGGIKTIPRQTVVFQWIQDFMRKVQQLKSSAHLANMEWGNQMHVKVVPLDCFKKLVAKPRVWNVPWDLQTRVAKQPLVPSVYPEHMPISKPRKVAKVVREDGCKKKEANPNATNPKEVLSLVLLSLVQVHLPKSPSQKDGMQLNAQQKDVRLRLRVVLVPLVLLYPRKHACHVRLGKHRTKVLCRVILVKKESMPTQLNH